MTIFPNPASDELYINGKITPEQVTITDMAGRVVIVKTNTKVIDVAGLPTGLYQIRIDANNLSTTSRFVKQ